MWIEDPTNTVVGMKLYQETRAKLDKALSCLQEIRAQVACAEDAYGRIVSPELWEMIEPPKPKSDTHQGPDA